MKKIIYIANARMPTEKAHGLQIMKMCEAFANNGVNVELVVPRRKNLIKKEPFDYYNVKKSFSIKVLPCVDTIGFGKIGFYFQRLTFAFSVFFYILRKDQEIFYTRGEFTALVLKLSGKINVTWEAHRGSNNLVVRILSKRNINLIVISRALKKAYASYGFFENRILVAPDAVDLNEFILTISQEEARKKVGFSMEEKIILYTGHLYDWKGVGTLAKAAKNLKDFKVVFVGGTEKDIDDYKKRYGHFKNILIVGQRLHEEIPTYLKSADVLVLPNSAKEDISRLYTSPMKLFEYMASGIPIVASDLPSLREILDESTAFFFEPDNEKSLINTVKKVFAEYSQALHRAQSAVEMVKKKYTWEKRALNILNFVND